ncbi:P pilus assembly/Cpx signaling pathway, periplasmic inhibitor/zinc-resistance associated protein [Xenococcus sp. PCC 7305]|uniref:Spy/CpxP family protein refolding chaperone n=1 Tax=Xenococcus sp. PCC 7305 TaxID=102125 RepID=UPI0002AC7B80|nr:Spy/CpxP family protein refolding chaperone [Xenococcus sp. PCC 7305]ELS01313.1 P pilus assembly/Cpx signaling pathway, periplasmic inhibitor/zinc-resistance associated protein [Xenococcus sp. PCC 7305]
MRIATLLITVFSFFKTIPCSANASFPIQNLSRELYSSWLIAENHHSIDHGGSKITLFQQLNLTVNQQEKIEKIHRFYYPKIIKLKKQLTVIKEELTNMMSSTESATVIRIKHQEVLEIRQKLGKLQLETMLETREVLTLEQRQNFAELLRAKQP